jgi:2-oxoglutarate ferredoxin oxidoreductase subunit beta
MLSELDGPAYLERVTVNNVKNVNSAKKPRHQEGVPEPGRGQGLFAHRGVSSCPTNWGMTPQKALQWIDDKDDALLPAGRKDLPRGKGGR